MVRSLSVSKAEQKEIKLEIGLPPTGFSKTMYFNRFRIEREEGLGSSLCMRNNVFIARLAHGAVVSTMAACLMPQSHSEEAMSPDVGQEAAFTDRTSTPDDGTQQGPEQAVTVTTSEAVSEWDKQMEREFRKLALEEAKGTLTAEQALRLEELNRWRDRLLNPQSAEEILLQIKRDRLLERMEELLKEYVEFQEAAGKKRAAT